MVIVEKIIVDKLQEACITCQFFQDNQCYALKRDDYDAETAFNMDYRRSDCPMVEKV